MYVSQVGNWRRLWGATYTAFVLFFSLGVGTVLQIHENNVKRDQQIADLKAIAEDIDAATSPEAQANQAKVVQNLVVQIDCNQRDALQEVIDGLRENRVLSAPITVLTPECEEHP
jgi:hypothetical protein